MSPFQNILHLGDLTVRITEAVEDLQDFGIKSVSSLLIQLFSPMLALQSNESIS